MTKIAVLDVLGPMYHYDAQGWIEGAAGPLVKIFKDLGLSYSSDQEAAQIEEDLMKTNKTTPVIMQGFAEYVLGLRERSIRPVVVSAGTPWVLEHTLELAAQDHYDRTGQMSNPEDLVEHADLISTVPIGSKKKPETWAAAVANYDAATIAVFEDTFANLTAAIEGLNAERGYHITSTKHGLAQVLSDSKIYRGHMEEAGSHSLIE